MQFERAIYGVSLQPVRQKRLISYEKYMASSAMELEKHRSYLRETLRLPAIEPSFGIRE